MAPTVKPSTAHMVKTALAESGKISKKGISVQAIKKYIANIYEMDPKDKSLSRRIAKYLEKSVEAGKIVQTTGKGCTGSFKLGKTNNKVEAKKIEKVKKPIKLNKDAEILEKPEKPKKIKEDKPNKEKTAKKTSNGSLKKDIKKIKEQKTKIESGEQKKIIKKPKTMDKKEEKSSNVKEKKPISKIMQKSVIADKLLTPRKRKSLKPKKVPIMNPATPKRPRK